MRREVNGERWPTLPEPPIGLTATQEGMWFAERLDPGRSGYHDAVALHLVGPLRVDLLRQSLADCRGRHDALRLRIREDGGRLMQTFDAAPPHWFEHDLSNLAPVQQTATCRRRFALDCTEPFDLATGPLWRTRLLRLGDSECKLLVVMHHLMTDGWSHGVFLQSLISRYTALRGGSPAHGPSAPSFRLWASRRIAAETAPAVADKTRQAAADLHSLPRRVDLPGVVDADQHRGGVAVLALTPADMSAFSAACAKLRVSRFMAMAGLLAYLVGDITGTPGLVVSAPVADRLTPEATQVLGCTINTIPILFGPATSPTEAAAGGRPAVASALRLLDVPYREIIRAAEPSFTASLADPLTNISCEESNVPRGTWRMGDLTVTMLPRGEFRTRHDLTLSVPRGATNAPELIYPAQRWAAEAIADVAARLAGLVRALGWQLAG